MTADIDTNSADKILNGYRTSIDNLDAALIHIIAERFRITRQVGKLKASNKLPASDKEREKNQTTRLRSLASEAGLDPDFAENLLNFIIQEVISHHKQARN